MGDLIREVRVKLHGFDMPSLDNKIILLKMIQKNTPIMKIKEMLSQKITNRFASKIDVADEDVVTLAPIERISLTFKQEVLWEEFGLDHYRFRNVLGQSYAELSLFLDEESATNAVVDVRIKAKKAWLRAGKSVREKVHTAFVPNPDLATKWIPKAGPPNESIATRHAKKRGGTKGVIDLLKEYNKHSTSAEECCWTLLMSAAESEDANDFRERLIEREKVIPVVVRHLQRALKKKHWGALKQTLGLLWYLIKDQLETEFIVQNVEYKMIEYANEAVKYAGQGLEKMKISEKTSALASAYCDVAELGANVIACLVCVSDGRAIFKGLKVRAATFSLVTPHLEGVPHPQYVLEAFEECERAASRKKMSKKK